MTDPTPRQLIANAQKWVKFSETSKPIKQYKPDDETKMVRGLAAALSVALDENDRLRESETWAVISAATFREEADRLREVIAEAVRYVEDEIVLGSDEPDRVDADDLAAILAKAAKS